ncbi:MAG: hypothetical protein ALECFALPRED_007613 [Alectoria fallacina]|uniref:Ecp2 effector protein domain-containing protein n=1 Tax=Alectoria fallacina TaxID=1903189 RepID=A0A8H3IXX8_9LECA|nr:MAG: hypothetical protein ALECFALPRED_007613 [Alectoria fallacina]
MCCDMKKKMPYRLAASILSSILLTLILAAPASAATPLTPNTTTTTTPPTLPIFISNINDYTPPQHKCTKPGFFKSDHRPSWAQCYRAIRALPTSYDRGTFHNYGNNDGYRLPLTEKFGRCRAQVEITERTVAVNSWVAVVAALDQLSILCRQHSSRGDRTAGWMLTGPEERIKVSLLGPDDPYLVGGVGLILNATDVE